MTRTIILATALLTGCLRYQDVPQAHKGRYFDKASMVCFGGHGLTGPILESGTYNVGWCDEVRLVDCSLTAVKEPMTALTKDGVQFGLDVYVTYSANCGDPQAMEALFANVAGADAGGARITADQLWNTFLRPSLGEAVRETVSPYNANDMNDEREAILANTRKAFLERVGKLDPAFVRVQEINLSNMDFPETMDQANTERATQAVLKDKAIAERERVEAEIETAKLREQLAQQEGKVEAARIAEIGQALARNPQYLQYQLQQQMPTIYGQAAAAGNLVIAAPNPMLSLQR
jgi:regulator of protease activity HflC (stomatin/prohibitin superfamily)